MNAKSKTKISNDFMESVNNKCILSMPEITKLSKIEPVRYPTIQNYDCLFNSSFSISMLKEIAKGFKLKLTGTKTELIHRIYIYLKLSSVVISIQKIFRGRLQRICNKLRGPAFIHRSKCTNDTDFLSGDTLVQLSNSQFISYIDVDGFIYGFDVVSLYNLFIKSGQDIIKNPYNRNEISHKIIQNMIDLIRISKVLKINMDINISNDLSQITPQKSIELRILDLFQTINSLGNYSDHVWFSSLNRSQLVKFLRELIDIWNYRAQLSETIKREICPPSGDPFRNISLHYIMAENNIDRIRKCILDVVEKMINTGISNDNKSLGAYYILGALTLVSQPAAISMPWLFQSVSYM